MYIYALSAYALHMEHKYIIYINGTFGSFGKLRNSQQACDEYSKVKNKNNYEACEMGW